MSWNYWGNCLGKGKRIIRLQFILLCKIQKITFRDLVDLRKLMLINNIYFYLIFWENRWEVGQLSMEIYWHLRPYEVLLIWYRMHSHREPSICSAHSFVDVDCQMQRVRPLMVKKRKIVSLILVALGEKRPKAIKRQAIRFFVL